MPRWLTFSINGTDFQAYLQKFSRDMLYGKSTVERRGEDGEIYQIAYLTSDGTRILTSGGFSSNYLTLNGVIPEEAIKVDEQGEPLPVMPSMFKEPIKLRDIITIQQYFYYEIEFSYALKSETDLSPLKNACEELLKQGKLFRFPYAYYETTQKRDAILVPKNNEIFVIVGSYQEPQLLARSDIMYVDEITEEQLEEELLFEVW